MMGARCMASDVCSEQEGDPRTSSAKAVVVVE